MSARRNVLPSGSSETSQEKRRRQDSCVHHWILENTKYPIIKGLGQSSKGTTKARCKDCGKSKRTTATTPDSIHGIESLIASNIREELPDIFELEGEDYDA